MHSVTLHTFVLEPTTKICMKIDPYYQRQKCSPGKISFMRIFVGVRWRRGRHVSGMVENGDFCFFRLLYRRNCDI